MTIKTVFFVHDQQESAAARQNLLEMAGYRVVPMKSVRDLFVFLKEETPDIVLMDVLIEGPNGFEATRELNAKMPERSFPILLTSRIYRARQFRDEALRCGAHDYMLLPTKPDVYLSRVSRAMEEHAEQRGEAPGNAAA
jgi:twitching motility two-component system response regulator PilH